MTTALTNRESLISSAVGFLQDPAVATSPLAKRIAFLESKGLTPSEVEVALRRASNNSESHGFSSGYRGLHQSDRDATDWRDWFVMTVIGGGVGYLLINLAKKYLIPALKPPTQTDLEQAQANLEKKYDEVAEILRTIQTDTEIVKKEMTQQTGNLDRAMREVEAAVEECLSGEVRRDQELASIQQEVDALQTSIKQMMQSNKEIQTASIIDLQTELKSLKSLMAARSGPSSISGPPPPNGTSTWSAQNGASLNTFGLQSPANSSLSRFNASRPVGIPAWQLASGYSNTSPGQATNGDQSSNISNSTATAAVPTSSPPPKTLPYMNGNGKPHDLHDLEFNNSEQNLGNPQDSQEKAELSHGTSSELIHQGDKQESS